MSLYSVNGLTVATAATVDHAIAAIWNPDANRRIWAHEVSIFAAAAPGAGSGFELRRITARGTAGSTVTPDADNAHEANVAPASGFLLDLATYSAQPTLATPPLGLGFVFAAVAASGIVMPLRRIMIPAGTGLALVNRAAIIVPACEVSWVIEE
jgi:hypothetical protein